MVQFGTGDCTGKMWGMGRRDQKLALWGGCKHWISTFIYTKMNGLLLSLDIMEPKSGHM